MDLILSPMGKKYLAFQYQCEMSTQDAKSREKNPQLAVDNTSLLSLLIFALYIAILLLHGFYITSS